MTQDEAQDFFNKLSKNDQKGLLVITEVLTALHVLLSKNKGDIPREDVGSYAMFAAVLCMTALFPTLDSEEDMSKVDFISKGVSSGIHQIFTLNNIEPINAITKSMTEYGEKRNENITKAMIDFNVGNSDVEMLKHFLNKLNITLPSDSDGEKK